MEMAGKHLEEMKVTIEIDLKQFIYVTDKFQFYTKIKKNWQR